MARIEQVKVHRGPFHVAGSPVALEAYALLIDRKTGRYYAQVKFVNVCESKIASVIVAVTASTLGNPVEVTHIYPAINLSPGAAHGSQEAVPLGDTQATDIKVSVRRVELKDGAKWEATADAEWIPLPARKPLEDLEAPSNCLGMYRSVFGSAKYIPWTMGEIWQCSCGALNPVGHSTCSGCGYLQADIMTAIDADSLIDAERRWKTIGIKQVILALTELAEKRAEEEELTRKKEEAARIEAERRAEHEKKRAEEKAARDAKNLAEARKLIAKGGEEQLNRAIQILKLVPKRASEKSLVEAKTKLVALAALSSNDPSAMKSAAEMLPNDDNSKELRNELINKATEIVSKQKRLSRLAIIAGLCTVVVIGGSVLATNVIGAATKRHQAEQLTSEGNYREAMAIYAELDDGEKYEQTQGMQCETEYQYVKEHLINSDETTYQYLCELKDLGYKDAADIYSSLYQWHFELVATTKEAYEAKGLVNLTEYREPAPLSESACAVLKCWGGYPGEEKEAFVHFAYEVAPFTTSTRHLVTGYKTLEGGLAADSDDAVHLFQLNLDTEYDVVPEVNKPVVSSFEITQVPRDMTSITAEAYVDGFGRFDSSKYTNSGSAFASVLLSDGTVAPVATSGTITTTIQ